MVSPYPKTLSSNDIEEGIQVVFVLMKTTCTAEKLKGPRTKGQRFVSEQEDAGRINLRRRGSKYFEKSSISHEPQRYREKRGEDGNQAKSFGHGLHEI